MTDARLYLPRRLAIRLLSDAQRAVGSEIRGVIGARSGGAVSAHAHDSGPLPAGESPWACYRSHPAVNWSPRAEDFEAMPYPGLPLLVISLDTKGVLQLRGWELRNGKPTERELVVRD